MEFGGFEFTDHEFELLKARATHPEKTREQLSAMVNWKSPKKLRTDLAALAEKLDLRGPNVHAQMIAFFWKHNHYPTIAAPDALACSSASNDSRRPLTRGSMVLCSFELVHDFLDDSPGARARLVATWDVTTASAVALNEVEVVDPLGETIRGIQKPYCGVGSDVQREWKVESVPKGSN